MTNDATKPPLGEPEFNGLRAEILQRAQFQQQLVNLSVIIAGTLLTVFFQFTGPTFLLLVYPLLAMFMAIEWSFNNMRICQIGRYIKGEIEAKWGGSGWETYLTSPRSRTPMPWLSGVVFAYGTFTGLSVIVLVLAVVNRFSWAWPEIIFLAVDTIVAVIVIPLIVWASELSR